MNDEPQLEPEFNTELNLESQGYVRRHRALVVSEYTQCRYTGAFFPKAKHFVVAGGKFKSITNIHHAASAPAGREGTHSLTEKAYPPWIDFRVIPLGDLNLLHTIGSESGAGAVRGKHGRPSFRTVYSAEIYGCKSHMTVALYQGNGAQDVRF
jgi:hypothetical protein